jgi:hypothetical protein
MKLQFKKAKNFKWEITRNDDLFQIIFGLIKQDKNGVRVLSFILFGFQLNLGWVWETEPPTEEKK